MFPDGKVPVLQDIFSGLVSLPTQYLMVISTSLEILSSPSPHFFYDIKSSLRKIWWPYQAGNNLHDFILANILKSSDSLEADLFNLSRRVDFPFCWWQYWSTFCISWGGRGLRMQFLLMVIYMQAPHIGQVRHPLLFASRLRHCNHLSLSKTKHPKKRKKKNKNKTK